MKLSEMNTQQLAVCLCKIAPALERIGMDEGTNRAFAALSGKLEGGTRMQQLAQMVELLIYEMSHKEKHYKRVTKGLSEALLMELYRLCTQEKSELSMRVISRSNLVLINDALDYINKNYMDSGLRIETLAERCGLSETHFRRVFKEQTNMSPSEAQYLDNASSHELSNVLG